MIYTQKRDDIPLLSQWIKSAAENVSFSAALLYNEDFIKRLRSKTTSPAGGSKKL